ncbi:NSMCE1 family protein [Megaselia abdita]
MSLSAVQRIFLQAVASNGAFKVAESKDILKDICGRVDSAYTDETYGETVEAINAKIREFNQELKTIMYPPEKANFLVFINLTTDAMNKVQFDKPKQELDFFRDLLMAIIKSEEKYIGILDATNLVSTNKGKALTKSRAQAIIEEWIEEKYFFEKDYQITLGPRAITEFSNYFQSEFADEVNSCPLCKQVSFWGLTCTECKEEFHRDCITTYLKKKTDCPFCHAAWNTPVNQ